MNKELETLEDLSKQEIIVKKGIGIYMDGSVQTMPHKTTVGVEFKGHIETVKQALTELQQIKEANPSEALERLEDLRKQVSFANSDGCIFDDIYKDIIKDIEFIKQALLKAQDPKKYLKWEDLEFKKEEQTMEVILNGSEHFLCYYKNVFGNLCIIDNPSITIRKENKDFFNDLHLERVVEE